MAGCYARGAAPDVAERYRGSNPYLHGDGCEYLRPGEPGQQFVRVQSVCRAADADTNAQSNSDGHADANIATNANAESDRYSAADANGDSNRNAPASSDAAGTSPPGNADSFPGSDTIAGSSKS